MTVAVAGDQERAAHLPPAHLPRQEEEVESEADDRKAGGWGLRQVPAHLRVQQRLPAVIRKMRELCELCENSDKEDVGTLLKSEKFHSSRSAEAKSRTHS